jgi:hypothetical protein
MVAIILIVVAFGGILYMKGATENQEFKIKNNCPEDITMSNAYND